MTTSITKKELYDSFEKHETRYGATIHREIVCDWDDRLLYKPAIGQPYPGEPNIRCTDITWRGVGKPAAFGGGFIYEQIKFVCEYSTAPFVDSAPIETWDFSGEVLETGLGRTWESIQRPCESTQGVFYPSVTRNISMVVSEVNTSALFACIGGVNWTYFQGFYPESLLLEGATCEQRFDYERNQYTYTVNLRMIYRRTPHNYIYRAPKQAIDPDTEAPMVDSDGYPVYLSGPEGEGGWDRPIPLLYRRVDFSALFPGMAPNLPPWGWDDDGVTGTSGGGPTSGVTLFESNPSIPWVVTNRA